MKRLIVGLALLIAACEGGTPLAAPTPLATDDVTPDVNATQTVERPWPAEFEEKFCLAVAQHSVLVDDLIELEMAAEAGDTDRTALMAYAAGGNVQVIDYALELAPEYKPAAKLIKAWRAANAAMIVALNDLDKGATNANQKRFDRGVKRLTTAANLLTKATGRLEAFIADTGFECR